MSTMYPHIPIASTRLHCARGCRNLITRAFSIGALILLTAVSTFAQNGTVMPNPKFTGFDNNGLIVGSGRLCTYAAGTTTPQATYTDVGLSVANTNPVTLDAAGRATVFLSATSYKFVLRAAGGALTGNTAIDCAATTQLWSQDNVSAIPSSAATVDATETAGEALTAGQVAYLSDGSGGKTQGLLYKADATNTYSSTAGLVGMVPNAILSGASGTFRTAGAITGLSALTVGTDYYVSGTAGALTSTAPANARYVGRADSTTSLIISRGMSALALPSVLTQSNAAGVTTLALATQSANVVLAGPISGSAATAAFRALDPLDLSPTFVAVTSQVNKTDTTLASITGLSFTLVAGQTYRFRVVLHLAVDATGGVKMDFNGGTATVTTFSATAVLLSNGATNPTNANHTTTLSGALLNFSSGQTTGLVYIDGYIVVNGAGTLIPRFAQSSASGTSSVLVGSTMELY